MVLNKQEKINTFSWHTSKKTAKWIAEYNVSKHQHHHLWVNLSFNVHWPLLQHYFTGSCWEYSHTKCLGQKPWSHMDTHSHVTSSLFYFILASHIITNHIWVLGPYLQGNQCPFFSKKVAWSSSLKTISDKGPQAPWILPVGKAFPGTALSFQNKLPWGPRHSTGLITSCL